MKDGSVKSVFPGIRDVTALGALLPGMVSCLESDSTVFALLHIQLPPPVS